MKNMVTAIKIFLLMTLITGIIYPAIITLYSLVFVGEKSAGSFISRGRIKVGSELIAQKFINSRYFWNRPSSIDYNPITSGASNLGPTSKELQNQVEIRKNALLQADENEIAIPQDLLFASGSGLDPHISPEAAFYQAPRVAKSRGLELGTVNKLIVELTEAPQYGIFGDSRINTLKLNLAIDDYKK
jgi:K+-transporting ATPase ATPase C chain